MTNRKVKLEIVWTHAAEIQLQSILKYWLERNQSSTDSQKLAETILDRIEFPREYPDSAKLTDYPQTKNVVLGHYSIIYKI